MIVIIPKKEDDPIVCFIVIWCIFLGFSILFGCLYNGSEGSPFPDTYLYLSIGFASACVLMIFIAIFVWLCLSEKFCKCFKYLGCCSEYQSV